MTWGGGVGSGNLLMGASEAFAVGTASISALTAGALTISSGFSVTTAANVAGSAAAIVGRPEFYFDLAFRGTTYLVPIYRKT